MKIVNFAKVVHNLEGKPMMDPIIEKDAAGKDVVVGEKPVILSKVIGNILAQHKAQDDLRQFRIAEQIYNSTGEIELEDSDFKMVERVIAERQQTSRPMSCMVGKVFQECLKTAKDKEK